MYVCAYLSTCTRMAAKWPLPCSRHSQWMHACCATAPSHQDASAGMCARVPAELRFPFR